MHRTLARCARSRACHSRRGLYNLPVCARHGRAQKDGRDAQVGALLGRVRDWVRGAAGRRDGARRAGAGHDWVRRGGGGRGGRGGRGWVRGAGAGRGGDRRAWTGRGRGISDTYHVARGSVYCHPLQYHAIHFNMSQ